MFMRDIRTVIADDHKLFRKGLSSMFEDIPGISVVGEAANGQELLSLLTKEETDLILMDLKMPLMDGIEATEQIKSKYPDIKIIVLSMYEDERFIIHLLELGVNGYLLKNAEPEEMEYTINTVIDKDFCFNDQVTNIMRKNLFGTKKGKPNFDTNVQFTPRELQILKLVCKEMTNQEIGVELHLSSRTVEGHRKKILEKTGAKNTAGMVYFAVKNGIIDLV